MLSDHIRIKLEINNRKVFRKSSNTRKLNNTVLNILWVNEEITQEIRKYFELNENENVMSEFRGQKNLWRAGKAVFR